MNKENKIVVYCVPVQAYEVILDFIEDLELLKILKDRRNEDSISVTLDDLC